ncbi:L-glutamate gamma-semialdehyde dehydrogenase [Mechercharimyces sp. CAU 1602]|uniref:L-glutamate gamma-semialdehyde dehydrogenase n=1 Tax=Mechercharimyces sp. CAU 1602 TaxID=2973933 RepID=UPI0021635566|nr:L-glutamate gamma-semialdehyde dehydrogenase [Mechercharimyces sp. CAU 1602]MCS1352094.1 L-glutamate gamma-semialdehyde dehydrogenase [Mechercharimyces sp. CAU 1602]
MIPYKHDPWTNFSVEENRRAYEAALKKVEAELGGDFDLIVDGKRIKTDDKITSYNPSNKEQVIGTVSKAKREHAEEAMQAAWTAFEEWRKWSPKARAEILFRASAIVKRRRHEFSALMTLEAGKSWVEADGDTSEAIDFMEFYGRQMIQLAQGKPCNSSEFQHNEYNYQPVGVGFAVPPWNFPFAIMCGITVSALVTGNAVLLKPSSNTPIIAAKFVEVLEEAGLPKGVLNFIPGSGSEIGDYIVDHPKLSFVSFTGSREVGCRIYERAAKVQEGQQWLKRVVAEMGGKDTIIVDRDADLELAAQSIVKSAFGYSGQKCSACSRAIVHQDVYEQVLERTIELTKELPVGNPTDVHTFVGPVIDAGQFRSISEYIEIGKQEGSLRLGGEADDSTGYFIQPTIIADLDPNSRIMQEEIFGPVLGFSKAKDFEELLEIANNTDYALTGAIISNNREHLERARRDFQVGNLYLNRGCTGSIVGEQPFGGFKMSGTDAKAGGPDYLRNFLHAKTVSEAF